MSKLYLCRSCKKRKDLNEFYLRKNGSVGEYICKACILLKRKSYYESNYEKARTINRVAVSKHQKKYREKGAAKVAEYNARKKQALPKWITKEEIMNIRSVYKMARQITKKTGVRHEVDHIIPLRGTNVCGLHTIKNLQVIPKLDNLLKGNKLFDDIVCTNSKELEFEKKNDSNVT